MVRVAIIDDQPIMREGIVGWLHDADGIEVVGSSEDIERSAAFGRQPDVVLLSSDDLDALDTDAVHRRWPRAAMVTYTSTPSPEAQTRAVSRGVAVCVPREVSGEELVRAIGAAASHATAPPPVQSRRREGDRALTRREREILRIVAAGASNRGIAAELDISEHTVKSHLHHAMRKLGVETRTAAVHHATRHALI